MFQNVSDKPKSFAISSRMVPPGEISVGLSFFSRFVTGCLPQNNAVMCRDSCGSRSKVRRPVTRLAHIHCKILQAFSLWQTYGKGMTSTARPQDRLVPNESEKAGSKHSHLPNAWPGATGSRWLSVHHEMLSVPKFRASSRPIWTSFLS